MTLPPELWPRPDRAGFRHRVGLRPLDPHRWVVVDDGLGGVLDGKERLLAERRAEVLAAGPDTEAASTELLALLVAHLAADHADTHTVEATKVRIGDRTVALDADHPLAVAGRLVADDWCLLDDEGDEVRLVAATLCSPSRWRLADKLGHGMPLVHGPVPGYPAQLEAVVDATLRRIDVDRPVWRSNWTITDDPALFQPEVVPAEPCRSADDATERLWLRIERQTLRRLAVTRSIVFGIRTFQVRIGDVDDEHARDLAAAVEQLPAATVAYKSLSPHRDALLAALRR